MKALSYKLIKKLKNLFADDNSISKKCQAKLFLFLFLHVKASNFNEYMYILVIEQKKVVSNGEVEEKPHMVFTYANKNLINLVCCCVLPSDTPT